MRFADLGQVKIRCADFLCPADDQYDHIIGNPPYVPITGLTEAERSVYRERYITARGRCDLYLLFWEQALQVLSPGGRLVYITPEKYLYVESAAPLRRILTSMDVNELHFVDEATFGELITYPLITTVTAQRQSGPTLVVLRDGRAVDVRLDSAAESWLPLILGAHRNGGVHTLADVCTRVSCGVATGADGVFVVTESRLDPQLREYAYPTIAGRELRPGERPISRHLMLVPYDTAGKLLPEDKLNELGRYLSAPERRSKLEARTCVRRKPWYAFHENPPLLDLLQPKILCKDIGASPFFVVDAQGKLVPRHSVYYIVPLNPEITQELADYLNSTVAQQWLRDHCQRAANGCLRLQSHVLKQVPIPDHFATAYPARKLSA